MSENGYKVVIQPEGTEDGYIAYVPELPDCHSYGATLEETRDNIRKAIEGRTAAVEGQLAAGPDQAPASH